MAKQTISEIRRFIEKQDKATLVSLICDLYSISPQNRNFLETRFIPASGGLEKYKKIITKALYPDVISNGRISFRDAKKAISDYKKAVGTGTGLAELLVYAFECGNNFTCEYGDMDEPFYDSMIRLFNLAVDTLAALDPPLADSFIRRLSTAVKKANCIGWGYYDAISEVLGERFPVIPDA